MSKTRILYSVNSSLLVSSGSTKLLIDGLHGQSPLFSDMSPQASRRLFNDLPPFDNIDAVLFTHCHPDHFSYDKTKQYLTSHKPDALVLPQESGLSKEKAEELGGLLKENAQFLEPKLGFWQTQSFILGDFKIVYVRTPHVEAPMPVPQHCSILLEAKDCTIFIAGDADFPSDEGMQFLLSQNIDFGFFIPFYIMHSNGHKALKKLNLKRSYIYHLAYQEADNPEFLAMIEKNFAKNAPSLPPTVLLPTDSFADLPITAE